MTDILNKRILYIGCTKVYYDQCLIQKIEELGGIVDTFNIDIINIYFAFLNRYNLSYAKTLYRHIYYNQLLTMKDYDYVIVRQGYQIEIEPLRKLRTLNPNAKFINMHWDSLRKQYNYLPILDLFDKIVSFDYKDSQDHAEVEYLPLFYLDEYSVNNSSYNNDNKEFDVSFIGAWRNKERYDLIKLTEKLCTENNLRFYYYLLANIKHFKYFQGPQIIQEEAQTKKLSHKEILEKFSVTKSVIDFPSSFQTGLTIRCFETLAAGVKLITTNKQIANEPFYNPEFINIIDSNNLSLDIDFINNTPTSSIKDAMKNYSIESYALKLLQ